MTFRLPPVIGHRGAAAHAPENTLPGFDKAKALGCEWVEVDVRLAADGVGVLVHDQTLDRTTDGTGHVGAMSWPAMQSLDAGSWFDGAFAGTRIPNLEMALIAAKRLGLRLNLELKGNTVGPGRDPAAVLRAVMAAVRSIGTEPMLSSFDVALVRAARDHAPNLPRALLCPVPDEDLLWMAAALDCVAVGCSHKKLTADHVRTIRARDFLPLAFTVNEAERARELLGWGVAAVFSDRPEVVPR